MKGIMNYCLSFGSKNCDPDIISLRFPEKHKNGGPQSEWPGDEEASKYDHICLNCKHCVIEMKEDRCPFCGSERLIFISEIEVNAQPMFRYRCGNCRDENLFAYEEFI